MEEDTAIGFALDGNGCIYSGYGDLKEGWHSRLDYFNGATLTITITFLMAQRRHSASLKAGGLKTGKHREGAGAAPN